jgi:hypothetical protein
MTLTQTLTTLTLAAGDPFTRTPTLLRGVREGWVTLTHTAHTEAGAA